MPKLVEDSDKFISSYSRNAQRDLLKTLLSAEQHGNSQKAVALRLNNTKFPKKVLKNSADVCGK